MIAVLVIDMQVGLFTGPPRHDAAGVIARINQLTAAARAGGHLVVFIQHEDGRSLKPSAEGWHFLPELERTDADPVVHKQACDSFYETDLAGILERHGVSQLIVTGCATDFCVDTSVRAAASRDFDVAVAADAHTTKDRPHLEAPAIITHHNWMWKNLIHPHRPVEVLPTAELLARLQ